jgi:phosphate starvation-inducible protein PhoH
LSSRKNSLTLEFSDNRHLAAASAAHMLHEKRVDRLILSRPALEAGERLGFLPGDPSQSDLPGGRAEGLNEALAFLEGVGVSRFGEKDVVRHPLVARIVAAYTRHGKS